MSDNLEINEDGKASMAYTGSVPWHGLGTKVDQAMTAAEAIAAAKMDWLVTKEELFLKSGLRIEDKFATVRTDKNIPLGVVGRVYRPLQNREAFSFFDAVVGEKAAIYHTAGVFGKGERVWILAKLPGYIRVVGDDIINKFLLLTNSHDGTSPVLMKFCAERVVCANTLNVALREKGASSKIKHTLKMGGKVTEVKENLGIINNMYTLFAEAAQQMLKVSLTGDRFKQYAASLDLVPKDDKDTRKTKVYEKVSELFENGRGANMPGVKGSLWAGFNSIIEYVDYEKVVRVTDKKQTDARAQSLLFGSGSVLKQDAFDKALELIK